MTAVITKNSMRGISCNCSVPYAGHRRIYLFTPCHQAVDLCQRDGGVTSTEIIPLPQLTFSEAQAKLRALLARLEFCNMQEYHRQRTRHASLDVKAYFNHVLERMDDKTKQALNPLFCSWHGAWVPVSVRILSVLQAKRQEYLQGLDLHVQYFLDLLLLSIALGELEVLAEPFYQYLKQLPRPIQDAISQKLPLVPNSTNVAQLYVDVKVLYAQFNCNGKSLFSGSHYLTVVDELIERCEATRSLTIYRASSGGCTPCLRSMMWEFLLQFWFVSMRGCDVRLETFFLAISLTDRYLAMQPVEKAELFAFACSGLYLASKCEEVGQLPLRRFVEYINHSVSIDRILMLEKEMATRLQFKMDSVTSYDVAMALIADQVPAATHTQMSLLQYILSVQALNTFYTEHNIATLGTAAYFLSCVTTGVPTGRPSSEVLRLMELTIASLKQVRPNEKIGGVVLKVFASKDYSGVSQMQFVPYCEEFINARSD